MQQTGSIHAKTRIAHLARMGRCAAISILALHSMHRVRLLATLVMLTSFGVLFTACKRSSAPTTNAKSGQATNPQVFLVRGVVKRAGGRSVTIQHEEVPNFMPAMTMPFTVKDTNEIRSVQTGDSVSFRLHVTEDESWIDEIKKVDLPTTNEPPTRPPVRLVRDVEPLKVGELMPDYRFTNELGHAVSLSELKGQALAVTFIFTRCPLPEFCPLMSRNFSAVAQQLASTTGAPTNWHLLSISFDPHYDTPEVLKRYAQFYKYDPQHWNFVTGAMIDIDAITDQFDLPVVKQGENWEHKLRTVVIDAVGRIQKIFLGNQWTTTELVTELIKAAQARENPKPATKSGN